jgi:hypothetical protein
MDLVAADLDIKRLAIYIEKAIYYDAVIYIYTNQKVWIDIKPR